MSADPAERGAPSAPARRAGPAAAPQRPWPDVAALRRWLQSDAVLRRDGAILSWSNPRHLGYAYPEAAGLFLSTACLAQPADGAPGAAADRVAEWLCRSVGASGGVGRDGTTYLFDSAVALAGLLRYRAGGGRAGGDEPIHRLWRFVCEDIAVGAAVRPPAAAADGRWSTQFGAHLVKCVQSLHLYATAFGVSLRQELVAGLIDRCGRQPSPVYVHPFCYEQEGHLWAAHHDLGTLFEPIEGALEWLAELQQPDGAILAFANGMEAFGEARSDVTAQAVRLWLLGDRSRYGRSIARALSFLAACQTAEGGIRYAPARDDVCSWSTMFTLQAVDWFFHEPRLDDLI